MQSATTVVGVLLGTLLLTALSLCRTDVYSGDDIFHDIRREINYVAADSIPFRHFCSEQGLKDCPDLPRVHEPLTRGELSVCS